MLLNKPSPLVDFRKTFEAPSQCWSFVGRDDDLSMLYVFVSTQGRTQGGDGVKKNLELDILQKLYHLGKED